MPLARDLVLPRPRQFTGFCQLGRDAAMARKKEKKVPEIRERDIGGMKLLAKLLPLFDELRDVGCERDRAGNRQLHCDQYCLLVLLYLFNPILKSLRGIQQASELNKVQRLLGCPRATRLWGRSPKPPACSTPNG